MGAEQIAPAAPPASDVRATVGERLASLDALRGFDMFIIIGADDLMVSLGKLAQSGPLAFLGRQLDHAEWEGFTFYDLVFPLFVFMVGISIVLSMGKAREQPKAQVFRRIAWRGFLLIVFGILYSGGLRRGIDSLRLLNVLQRIGICYMVAATLFCTVRLRTLIATCVGLLVGYWALLTFVPVRDISLATDHLKKLTAETGLGATELFYQTKTWVTGAFDDGRNLTNHFDFQYLPLRKYDGAYDPEGLLSTLPSIATCLLGVFAGLFLKRKDLSDRQKVKGLAIAGVALLALGFLWGLQFPIIKKIWTSSYVLVAGGWSCLALALFYQVVDIWKYRRWATPFIWIGMNPIAVYLGRNFVDFNALSERVFGGPIKSGLGAFGPLLVYCVSIGLTFLVARYLYQKKIFLRI